MLIKGKELKIESLVSHIMIILFWLKKKIQQFCIGVFSIIYANKVSRHSGMVELGQ